MKLIQIAAVGKNRELGLNGDMPWGHSLKKDLAFFKNQTKGSAIVMGRKTFESLPKMLPGRKHIVISRNWKPSQLPVEVFDSPQAFIEAYKNRDETVYVIGGASIYEQMLPYSDQLILTEIEKEYPADTWYPEFERDAWDVQALDKEEDNGAVYRHVFYTRK